MITTVANPNRIASALKHLLFQFGFQNIYIIYLYLFLLLLLVYFTRFDSLNCRSTILVSVFYIHTYSTYRIVSTKYNLNA